jgi:hypothetical protein
MAAPTTPPTQVSPRVQACIDGAGVPLADLPRPSATPALPFQQTLYAFLRGFAYRERGWVHDKRVRDTGHFARNAFNGHSYNGTHPAVVMYYSPEVYCWLLENRDGALPDGAVIIKEMYPPPAARLAGRDVSTLVTPWWTVMIKDSRGSHDGWYWAALFDTVHEQGQRSELQPPDAMRGHHYPESSFGSYCVRCHASAARESTFASLENIEEEIDYRTGERRRFGSPLSFTDDGSWRLPQIAAHLDEETGAHPRPVSTDPVYPSVRIPRPEFATMFPVPTDMRGADILHFLPESHDRAVQPPGGAQFVTSDQCMSCHFGDNTPFGPNMFVPGVGVDGAGFDISPHGEWRWSMMGLAGRDPIFYAQLESEMTTFAGASGTHDAGWIADTCLSCHGGMGQRQYHIDHGPDALFPVAEIERDSRHGALARDGISCMLCHQMKDNRDRPLAEIYTGRFEVEPLVAGKNQILGPYEDVVTGSMEQALSMTPRKSEFLSSSRLCASCHTVHLPALDRQGNPVKAGFEQSTYLEWVNSDYYDGGATPRSCQSCHMPDSFGGQPLAGLKVANIQDGDMPTGRTGDGHALAAHGLLPDEQIAVQRRDHYRRHTLQGINLFALLMFKQFEGILGVRTASYMSGVFTGLDNAIAEATAQARERTATVELRPVAQRGRQLEVEVRVVNLAGHRLPSGVGFRRAFLEVSALAGDRLLWRSGRTNSVGALVDARGALLPSESGDRVSYQPHHQRIDAEDQVQVYEELVQGEDGLLTTSFLNIHHHLKDNRLLPRGWQPTPAPVEGIEASMFQATHPVGEAASDPDYRSGRGEDTVRYLITLPADVPVETVQITARLYYQSIPPNYLRDRFRTAQGPFTRRLYYLASRLDPEGTPVEGWKLLLAETRRAAGR